ncbi:MAG TPA: hypothetical protein VNW97_01450 [Candidatus Saccharimonadales bacterium]|jgi:hypothetical protein|nr:hypothetical protein [Candidatus Saccharimonadales bacterium]
MAAIAFAQVKFIKLPLEAVEAPLAPTPAMKPAEVSRHPELSGRFARIPGRQALFIIDRQGYRRLIPFPLTFIHLFKDACALQDVLLTTYVGNIAEGPSLDDGAVLMRGSCSECIYLLDQGCKRLITGQRIMEKYGFNETAVVVVRQAIIDAVPTGEVWE